MGGLSGPSPLPHAFYCRRSVDDLFHGCAMHRLHSRSVAFFLVPVVPSAALQLPTSCPPSSDGGYIDSVDVSGREEGNAAAELQSQQHGGRAEFCGRRAQEALERHFFTRVVPACVTRLPDQRADPGRISLPGGL